MIDYKVSGSDSGNTFVMLENRTYATIETNVANLSGLDYINFNPKNVDHIFISDIWNYDSTYILTSDTQFNYINDGNLVIEYFSDNFNKIMNGTTYSATTDDININKLQAIVVGSTGQAGGDTTITNLTILKINNDSYWYTYT